MNDLQNEENKSQPSQSFKFKELILPIIGSLLLTAYIGSWFVMPIYTNLKDIESFTRNENFEYRRSKHGIAEIMNPLSWFFDIPLSITGRQTNERGVYSIRILKLSFSEDNRVTNWLINADCDSMKYFAIADFEYKKLREEAGGYTILGTPLPSTFNELNPASFYFLASMVGHSQMAPERTKRNTRSSLVYEWICGWENFGEPFEIEAAAN